MFGVLSYNCVACGAFVPNGHPDYVPSIRVNGERQPICRGCHDRWNTIHRTSKGLPPIPLHPEAFIGDP